MTDAMALFSEFDVLDANVVPAIERALSDVGACNVESGYYGGGAGELLSVRCTLDPSLLGAVEAALAPWGYRLSSVEGGEVFWE
jgi:hypothetical protein